jgi:DNA repair protein RadC
MVMNKKKIYPNAICNWPEDDRPRERLLKHGEHTLSNAELLAILIRTGISGKSAVDIARQLLQKFKTLRAMSGVDVTEFKQISGLKDAKISQIKAAIELGRRMMSEEKAFKGAVKSSSDVLDKRNSITNVIAMEMGTIDKVNPSIRDILLIVLKYQSPAIIVAHNHPSGDIEPSNADKSLTRDLIVAASAMELRVFDHIIIGDNQYFSFADEGLIEKYEMQTVTNM